MYTACSAVVSDYFEKYRFFAFGTITTGNSVGLLAWPIISQRLFAKYGYSKAMALMCIPQFVHVVAGILFVPLQEPGYSFLNNQLIL